MMHMYLKKIKLKIYQNSIRPMLHLDIKDNNNEYHSSYL